MKKLIVLLFTIFAFLKAASAQQKTKADTINAALLMRIASHTLSKNDSAILRHQPGNVLLVNKGDTINVALLVRLANRTLSKADSAILRWQIMKALKIDTVYTKINVSSTVSYL